MNDDEGPMQVNDGGVDKDDDVQTSAERVQRSLEGVLRREHAVALLNRAGRATCPPSDLAALRILGCFRDAPAARRHALANAVDDCEVAIVHACKWALVSAERLDADAERRRIDEIVDAHYVALAQKRAEFEELVRRHQQVGLQEARRVAQERVARRNRLERQSPVAPDAAVEPEPVPAWREVRGQRFAVVSSIASRRAQEYAYMVLGAFDTEAEATTFLVDDLSKFFVHVNLDVVTMYEWFALDDLVLDNAAKARFREEKLDALMRARAEERKEVRDFELSHALRGQAAPVTELDAPVQPLRVSMPPLLGQPDA